jgi:hypothetical protein
MNQNIKIFLFCPIPNDQKPINEYISLKENEFTNWVTFDSFFYSKSLILKFFSLFLVLLPLVLFEFNYSLESLLITNFITTISININLLIVLSRWIQVNKRFKTSRLFYEEASWYDGQIWEKPLELIRSDNLLSSQKIEPTIKRLKGTLIFLNILIFVNFIILQIF